MRAEVIYTGPHGVWSVIRPHNPTLSRVWDICEGEARRLGKYHKKQYLAAC